MSDDEIIAVVQAHKEGKQIQAVSVAVWYDEPNPTWNFENYRYRVKPEPRKPREWLVHVSDNEICSLAEKDRNGLRYHCCPNVVRVREVID